MASRVNKRADLMRYYADNGRALEGILPLIGVSRATAMKYARKFGIAFPDHKRRYRKSIEGDD